MQRPVRSGSRAQVLNPLRISHPKIDKLDCQAQGADIFAFCEIPLMMRTVYIFIKFDAPIFVLNEYNIFLMKNQ
jgi:hypothetical protein